MCDCAQTSWDIVDAINERREKKNLEPVDVNWFYIKRRAVAKFFQPYTKIGSANIWDAKTAKRLVAALWKLPLKRYGVYAKYRQAA